MTPMHCHCCFLNRGLRKRSSSFCGNAKHSELRLWSVFALVYQSSDGTVHLSRANQCRSHGRGSTDHVVTARTLLFQALFGAVVVHASYNFTTATSAGNNCSLTDFLRVLSMDRSCIFVLPQVCFLRFTLLVFSPA